MLSSTCLTVTISNKLPVIETQSLPDEATLQGLVAYMWDDKKFQAFEYRDEEQLNLTDSFLRAFAAYLETHKLSSRIALSKANTSNKFFMEYCQPATMSQICEEVNRNETLPAEATEWIFKGDTLFSGSAVPVICRGCKRTSSDDHKHYN
ncbi:MAG: hypothetical protein ALECFALPRED_005810 [Alectoria fallacina]|uniref:Uncharacterized protein n=1 Tax=Alectoria fallacina TaxID=1903189 RepID=A0A8H3G1D5_9LECA|nr:MAG: hypothetical protein ALECFALPRED_005810 [Alectoria fallacina]